MVQWQPCFQFPEERECVNEDHLALIWIQGSSPKRMIQGLKKQKPFYVKTSHKKRVVNLWLVHDYFCGHSCG